MALQAKGQDGLVDLELLDQCDTMVVHPQYSATPSPCVPAFSYLRRATCSFPSANASRKLISFATRDLEAIVVNNFRGVAIHCDSNELVPVTVSLANGSTAVCGSFFRCLTAT
jgi:hypothetical protein